MKKIFTFLLMALLALAGFKSWAQMDVVIGTGTSYSSYSPFYSYYNYSYNEILYGADEIGTAGTINAISFQTTTSTTSKTYVLDIYMKNVTRTSFASATDWEKVSSSDLVCQTTMSGYQTGWVTFTLDTPFEYDGESSLMIAVDNNTGGYAQKYFYYTLVSGKEHGGYQDSGDIDPTNPIAQNTQNYGYRPNIKINITPTGLASHTITYVQPDNGTVSGPAEAYEGQPVTLTATPDANYALGQFFVNGSPIEGNTFTMPTSDVTVTATFVYHPTLTVNDGTNTNSCVPIYGYFADATCKSQFIIPASALGDMLGGTVSDMTFYLNSSSSISFTGTWDVYVKEVDNTTLSGFVSWSELGSAVYHGNMTITNGQLTVNFTAPITYNGNNLLIGFNETVSGNCPSTSWLGVSQSSNTAWYSTYSGAANPQQFLPKTTFDYTPNPNLHHITVNQPAEGGTISAPAAAISGTVVTLTATPELGYTLGEWIVTDADGGTVDVTDNSFEMPAKDITVTATFESAGEMYTITLPDLDPEIITGIDALFNSEHVDQAPEGTEITLVYATLNEGYIFNYWTLNGTPLPSNTFNMPANDVEIGVVLNERQRYAVIIDESIVNGTVEADPNTDILGGTQVTLTITPDTYYRLASLTVTDGSGDPVTVTNNKFSMPESNATVMATFEYHPTLTVNDGTAVNTNNNTGQVPFNGYNADNYNNKSQFVIPASALEPMIDATITDITFYLNSNSHNKEYTYDNFDIYVKEVAYTTVGYTYPEEFTDMTKVYSGKLTTSNYQLTIHFSEPYVYNGQNLMIGFNQTAHGTWGYTYWLGKEDGTEMRSRSGYGSSVANSYNFLPKTTFDFTPGEHRYNITTVSDPVAGGTVTTDQTNNKATAGTLVTLTATPEFGYAFGEWTTDPEVEIVDNQFEMPESDITVTATFTPVESYAISFNLGEYEGLVDVAAKYNDETITGAPEGTEVTLEYSNLNIGYTFGNWTLNGGALAGNTFTMPATDVEIGVSLSERPRYAVSIDGSITNGTITADPSTNILGNTTVTLTITPAEGYGLGELTVTDGSGDPVTVTNDQFTMPESNVTVTATFSPVLTLTVNDGTATNEQVPFYGWNADNYFTKSQFIIPANELEGMADGIITDLTFYVSTSSTNKDLTSDTWDIYVKEVNTTEQGTSYVDFAEMTKVYTGTLSVKNYKVTVHFDTPYTYVANAENPNLMIGFNQTTKGSYTRTYWLGVAGNPQNVAPFYSRASYGSNNASFNFLPKTTFTYTNPNLHGITLNQPEGGEIAASAGAALPGTIITLTATPELGYEFGEWIVTPSSVTIIGNTFEMPASDVTVTATFNEVTQYGIAFVGVDETLITVAATFGGETITEAQAGTEVTLEYSNLNIGYTVGNWTLNGEALAGNTFTMPAEAVEVGVVLNERPRFAVTIDEAITNGTITAEPSSEILGGTLVTLSITPETGYTLDVLTVTDAESNPVAVTNNTFTMPESNVTVTATFVHGITVYDGTNTNNRVPVFGSYADSDYKSQFIFPAEDLEAMAGGIINSMTFYASEEYVAIPGTWSVYVSEVENTTLSGLEDWANLDAVLEGATIAISGHQMTVNFATPFLYNGGNLLIGFNETNSGSYINTNWYGVTQTTNTAYYWYNYNSVSEGSIQFLPKTTFLYTPVTPYTVNLHVNGVVSEEEVSSLPTPENIPAGMTFCGWTSSDIATYTTEAPSYVTKATADGEDFYAVFSYTEEEQTRGQNWVKIASPSELVDGEEIVLIYNDSYVMGQRSSFGTNYNRYAVEVVDGRIASMPSEANVFTLSGTSGNWKLNYSDSEVGNTTLSYNTNDCLAYYGLWQSYGCDSYDVWTAEGTSKVIFKNNYKNEYIGEDESVYAELIHSVANANLACEAYKKDVATTTYYMTEVLADGEVTENTTAKNIIITTGIVTVDNNIVLTMAENGLFRNENAANFVFKDGAQLIYTGEETVNATFEKDIKGYNSEESIGDGWYFIANPTDNPTVNLSDGSSYDLYTFNPAAEAEWHNEQYNNDQPVDNIAISRETGYLYANSADFTLRFEGELIPSGEETINLTYAEEGTGIDFPGFNLIGNPFPCTAYISSDFDLYKLVNGSEVQISEDFTMDPCEAFFVEATVDNQEVTISTTAPTGKSYAMPIVVNSDRGETLDRAILHLEGTRNSHKFMMNPDRTNISFAKNGERFASVSRGDETEIPMNFTADHKGSYTISFNTENFEEGYLHLIDVVSGDDIDLLVTPNYTFEADADEYASRFRIVFGTTDINDDPATSSAPFVYISNGNLVINNVKGTASMQIIDMLGRIVRTETVSGSYNKPHNLKAGAYVITLDGKAQKIVIE